MNGLDTDGRQIDNSSVFQQEGNTGNSLLLLQQHQQQQKNIFKLLRESLGSIFEVHTDFLAGVKILLEESKEQACLQ